MFGNHKSLEEQHTSLSEELCIPLKNRIEEWHTVVENILRYLHNYNDFKIENEEEDKPQFKFLNFFYPQIYLYSEELGTVIEDDDTYVHSDKELSLKQKLEIPIAKKFQQTKIQCRNQLYPKPIRREINLYEDEVFRGEIWKKYIARIANSSTN
ncbi:uncharacterized protein TNCV_3856941 [Trichonephila clavipes]|nr:uncharacterized protein TNCV_3856941 [Trichonephila clavipes]